MAFPNEPEAYLAYLDACTLVGMANSRDRLYLRARRLLGLFKKYHGTRRLVLVTSVWAISEAHGVLYGALLKDAGVRKPKHLNNIRDIYPPRPAELEEAHTRIETVIQELHTDTDLLLWPVPQRGTAEIWDLSHKIGTTTGTWPPDSVHLAIALHSGCSLFVSDDKSLLNRIDYCSDTLINPYRAQEFTDSAGLPTFVGCGLERVDCRDLSIRRKRRMTALQVLHKQGFR